MTTHGTPHFPPGGHLNDKPTRWQKFKERLVYRAFVLCRPMRRTWDWEGLGKLGELKALKFSYVIFLVVPVAAKFITYLPAEYKFPGTELPVSLRPHLPFSWMLLYFSALSIS